MPVSPAEEEAFPLTDTQIADNAVKTLEGFKFDGMGNGPTEYRAADHQCFKDVLVVRGAQSPSNQFDLLDVIKHVPRAQVEYDASMFGGELGPYVV